MTTIEINGIKTTTINSYSCGPGSVAHTYDIGGGQRVYKIGHDWWLQVGGQFPQKVSVAVL